MKYKSFSGILVASVERGGPPLQCTGGALIEFKMYLGNSRNFIEAKPCLFKPPVCLRYLSILLLTQYHNLYMFWLTALSLFLHLKVLCAGKYIAMYYYLDSFGSFLKCHIFCKELGVVFEKGDTIRSY